MDKALVGCSPPEGSGQRLSVHCMGSLAVDVVFIEFVTLNRPRLLDRALHLRPNVLAQVAAVREPAGVPRAGALVDAMTEITLQPVRRRQMILFLTQDTRPCGTVGRRNLSRDGIHAACHGKIFLGSVLCYMRAGTPSI